MAYAYKRGGRWYIGYVDAEGRTVQRSTKCATKTEATRLAQDVERRAERVRLNVEDEKPEPITFAELAERYLAIQASTKRSFGTIKQRVNVHLVPWLGKKLVHQIVPADIEELLASKVDGLGPQSREHLRVHLQAIFTFAIKKMRVLRGGNPASEVEKIFIPKTRPKVLPAEAIPAVLASTYDEHRGIVAVALFTGLRKGEILGLKVANVSLEQRLIIAENSYDRATKGGKARAVPIPEPLVPFLRLELGRARSEYLFPNEAGEMRTRDFDLAAIFKRALARAGIVVGYDHICRRCRTAERRDNDVRSQCNACGMKLWVKGIPQPFAFKDLRSTFGTHAYELTGDIRFVQEVLGHHSVKTTEDHYARFRPTHLLEQAKKLNAAPTYAALTNNDPPGRQTGRAEEKVTVGQPLTTTRSRGLEPLTSGVTGRKDVYPRVLGGALSVLSHEVETGVDASGLLSRNPLSSPVTYSALTVSPAGCVSVARAGELLGLSAKRVYQLLEAKKLTGVRQGNRVWVRQSSVRGYAR